MHTALVISSGIFHPSLPGRLALWRALRATLGVTLRHAAFRGAAAPVEILVRADVHRADALVLYIHGKTISSPALDALDRFAAGGGGILAIHSATASFKETPRYTDLLGGRFTGHPPVGPLEIRAVARADEIFGEIAPFTVTDEAYEHELRDDIRVHFVARPAQRTGLAAGLPAAAPAAQAMPIVWTRRHGGGRICYVGLGHRAASLRHPHTIAILQAGLAWVCRATAAVAP